MPESLLTTTEAAAVLGLAPDSVRHYILRGLIAAEKRGRDYFITSAEIARFQAERRTPGNPTFRARKPKDRTQATDHDATS